MVGTIGRCCIILDRINESCLASQDSIRTTSVPNLLRDGGANIVGVGPQSTGHWRAEGGVEEPAIGAGRRARHCAVGHGSRTDFKAARHLLCDAADAGGIAAPRRLRGALLHLHRMIDGLRPEVPGASGERLILRVSAREPLPGSTRKSLCVTHSAVAR
jgi:hypothetical protein